jgi:anti-sigma regulatory factor (Ser/Thr protein kinase)
MQKKFHRSIDQLANIFHFTATFVTRYNIANDDSNAIDLAVEEIFTNMVKYNPKSVAKITLKLVYSNLRIVIQLIDPESQPFDMTKNKVYDLNQTADKRPVGKLGVHLVKRLMDHITYEHKNGTTIIKLEKHLGDKYA